MQTGEHPDEGSAMSAYMKLANSLCSLLAAAQESALAPDADQQLVILRQVLCIHCS